MMWPNGIHRPSTLLRMVLSGQIGMDDVDAGIQSWASLEIYKGARAIADMPSKEGRRAALARIPEKIRPYVEAEVRRIF